MDQTQTANQTQTHTCSYLKKTLQFLVPISIISFLVSYFFSVLPLIFHQLHFYSPMFPFFAHALDRKCMFLICNGILAFLANNIKLNNASALNYGGYMKGFDDDDDEQLPEMVVVFQENAASMEVVDPAPILDVAVSEIQVQQEQDDDNEEREKEMVITLENEEWGDEDEDYEVEENGGVDIDDASFVNEMRVSTEELNKKFDEFIRKMKEEIRFEARQQYVVVV